MRLRTAPLLAVSLVALSCSYATSRPRAHTRSDVITRDQMLQGNFLTVYDAVVALRSNWLIVRANTFGASAAQENVVVYYDATRLGDPSELKNIPVKDVAFVQHLDPVQATQRYGVGHSQGVIYVSSHAP